MQRPKLAADTPGVDLESMSVAELERLHAGLTCLAGIPGDELQALVQSVRADEKDG